MWLWRILFVVGVMLTSSEIASAQSPGWDGAHIGAAAGGSWGASSQHDVAIQPALPPDDGDYGVSGARLGGSIGYNLMINSLMYGIEADADWSTIHGSSSVCGTNHECGTKLNWMSTVRGRVGLPVAEATLLFVAAGLAVGEIKAYDTTTPGFSGTKVKTGWTVGAGLEQKWSRSWSTKIEYLFTNFGASEYFTIPAHTPEKVDLDFHTIRVGLNYHFSGPTP